MKYLFTLITAMVVSASYAQSDSTYTKYPATRKVDVSFEVGGLFSVGHAGVFYAESAGTVIPNIKNTYHKQSYKGNMAEIAVIVAKPVTQRLRIGGGINFDISNRDATDPNVKHASLIMPGYMDIKYNFINRRVSPFISSQIGAAYYIGQYSGGGAMAGLNLGVKGYVSNRVAFSGLIGGRFQHIVGGQAISVTDSSGNNTIQINPHYLLYFITVRFGVTF